MTFRTWALGAIGYAACWFAVAALAVGPAGAQATLVPNAIQQFFDSNGNPISSGTVGFFQPGTTNPKTTWQDPAQTTPYGNPITLNAAGEPNNAAGIWGTGSYRQIVQDANGNIIWDALTSTSAATSPGTAGDGLPLGFIMSYAGSVAPAGYDFAYGQAYVRATFPLLLAAITIVQSGSCINGSANVTGLSDTSQMGVGQAIESGCFPSNTTVNAIISPTSIQASTTATGVTGTYSFQVFPFGNGNGSTTFNLPDLRGYVPAGRDNMGGTAAARLTASSKVGGWDYTGAAGGVDALTLSTSQLPAHTHDVVINDPGHQHVFTFTNSNNNPGGGVAGVVSNITQSSSATAAVITNTADTLATATAASAGGGVATTAALGTMPTSFTVNGAQLQFGGTNYTNGSQTLTVLGGTCSTQPQLATTVAGGAVTSINSVATPGACSVAPPQITTLSDGSHTNAVARIALGNGSGYTTGAQVLTVVGGTCTTAPQVNVTVTGGSVAAVTSIAVAGSCTSPPPNPVATSGGGGTGAVLDIVYSTAPTAIVQPTITLNYIIKVSANSGGFTIPIANDTVLGNFSGMSAPPVATSPGVVFNFVCGTRGALYEVGVGGAGCLPPGLNGYVLTSNGAGNDPTYQPVVGTGGAVSGPSSSVVNNVTCWANAFGTVLKDCGFAITGALSVGYIPVATSGAAASWGTNLETSGDPASISCNPPTFGGGWTCQYGFTSTYTPAHTDFRATLNVFRTATGSGQGLGQASDAAAFLSTQKLNYLSSSVLGDIQVAFVTGAQGLNGDIGGIQAVTSKVYNSGSGTGGAVAMQNAAQWIDTSGNLLMNINISAALAEAAGGFTSHTGYGFISESWGATPSVAASQVTPYVSYYGGAFDANGNCPANCPTFTKLFVGTGARSLSHVFFQIDQGLNESGKVTLGSGSATGMDGNATRSGGTRLSMENISGSLIFANNSAATMFSLAQNGVATAALSLNSNSPVASAPHYDTSGGAAISLASGVSITQNSILAGFGASPYALVYVCEILSVGNCALYMIELGTTVLISAANAWVASTTNPGGGVNSGKLSVSYDGLANIRVYSNVGSTTSIAATVMKTH